jgi:hypothetical protein
VNGLSNNVSNAFEASEEMANSAVKGLSDVISHIADYVDSNMEVQPTIRPVLDLTDVVSGANRINELFNGTQTSVSLAEMANYEISRGLLYETNQNGVAIDNDDVVDAINTLRDDVSSLASVISNMKIVMDTGTLVGSLTNPLDKSLGRQQIYRGRGI